MSVKENHELEQIEKDFLVLNKDNGIYFIIDDLIATFIPKDHNFSDEQVKHITTLIEDSYKKGHRKGQLESKMAYELQINKLLKHFPKHQKKKIKEENKKFKFPLRTIKFYFSNK